MTAQELLKLKEERVKLIADARAVLEAAEKESREVTSDEKGQWEKLLDQAGKLKDQIDTEERQQKLEAELELIVDAREERKRESASDTPDVSDKPARRRETEFRYTVANGQERVLPVGGDRDSNEYRAAFESFLKTGRIARGVYDKLSDAELRALQADSDAAGGSMVPDEMFVAQLIKAVDDFVFVRGWAMVFQVTSADSLGAPALDNDPADSDWTAELLTGSADSTMTTGKRELHPHPLAKSIRVSNKLLRLSAIPVEALVRDRLAYKQAITQEKAFLTGTGASQPLGVFTASNDGISTGQDVSTGNTTTTIGADGLIEAKYTLKAPYRSRPSTRWMFHRDGVKQIAKLKDADGQYLFRPGAPLGNDPDTLLGIPVAESEYAPNTFTTGLYVGILGDWSNYWIAESLSFTIQRLNELYAATNQIGFIMRSELDGMPVLEEAFARVTLA